MSPLLSSPARADIHKGLNGSAMTAIVGILDRIVPNRSGGCRIAIRASVCSESSELEVLLQSILHSASFTTEFARQSAPLTSHRATR